MLKNTFCHIPGISLRTEQQLWQAGVHGWEQARDYPLEVLPRGLKLSFADYLNESFTNLERKHATYFHDALPTDQAWRLFSEFRDKLVYLDIETTGLDSRAAITTIALYDGQRVRHYVQRQNLHDFLTDIHEYEIIISYNGKAFDVPFIERYFKTKLHHAHIDLMYVLRSLGYTGGLKGCEKKLGLDRGNLKDVNGFFAVLLWQDWLKSKREQTLETLLAYNVQDVLNLETLFVKAYNLKLKATPFRATHEIVLSEPTVNPFTPDHDTIERLKPQAQSLWYR